MEMAGERPQDAPWLSAQDEDDESHDPEIGHLLRLLGAGASAGILIALGDGPLRTKELTQCVSGYAPRTVYRYASRLTKIGAIDREETPGVPSKVVHALTDARGTELSKLVEAYARTALDVLPDGRIVPHSWGSLTLLADLWESGMYEALNGRPRTATELARVDHDWSFHQVARRINLLLNGGFVQEGKDGPRRRHYELTDEARRSTAVILSLGRWREQHVVPAGEGGLTLVETADVLRAAIPLVILPEHAGMNFRLSVVPPAGDSGDDEVVWAEIDGHGAVSADANPVDRPHSWARGEVGNWIETLSKGTRRQLRSGGGESSLVNAVVQGMQGVLWEGQPAEGRLPTVRFPSPAARSGGLS
jgi:DNA-binding HxlR family transcriptional regulator